MLRIVIIAIITIIIIVVIIVIIVIIVVIRPHRRSRRSWDRLIDTFANTLKAKSAEAPPLKVRVQGLRAYCVFRG